MKKKVFLLALASFVLFGAKSAFCMKSKIKTIELGGNVGRWTLDLEKDKLTKIIKTFETEKAKGKKIAGIIEGLKRKNHAYGETLFFWVCKIGADEILKELIDSCGCEDLTCYYEFSTVVPITHGSRHHKKTLLHVACEKGHIKVVERLIPYFKKAKRINLEFEKEYCAKTTKGTALDIAVEKKDFKMIRLLVKSGAIVERRMIKKLEKELEYEDDVLWVEAWMNLSLQEYLKICKKCGSDRELVKGEAAKAWKTELVEMKGYLESSRKNCE